MATYREYPVGGALSTQLVCLWTQTAPATGRPYHRTVLPDACVDIVCAGETGAIVAGPATIPLVAKLPPGTLVVGARFRPGVAPSWLGVDAADMANRDVDLIDLWGRDARTLSGRLSGAASPQGRLALLQGLLAERLRTVRTPDAMVLAAVRRLAREPGLPILDLSAGLGVGERQLLRRFRQAVGYGPKTLQRILRLQRLLLMARGTIAGGGGLAQLAAAAGFADQAHMTREVGALTGGTPRDVLSARPGTLGMSDLFKPFEDAPG